jgi:hypothetical protein
VGERQPSSLARLHDLHGSALWWTAAILRDNRRAVVLSPPGSKAIDHDRRKVVNHLIVWRIAVPMWCC